METVEDLLYYGYRAEALPALRTLVKQRAIKLPQKRYSWEPPLFDLVVDLWEGDREDRIFLIGKACEITHDGLSGKIVEKLFTTPFEEATEVLACLHTNSKLIFHEVYRYCEMEEAKELEAWIKKQGWINGALLVGLDYDSWSQWEGRCSPKKHIRETIEIITHRFPHMTPGKREEAEKLISTLETSDYESIDELILAFVGNYQDKDA